MTKEAYEKRVAELNEMDRLEELYGGKFRVKKGQKFRCPNCATTVLAGGSGRWSKEDERWECGGCR